MKVVEAWSAVMADLQSLGKDGTAPGNIGGYKFRGIDAVMNAVGPILREHGVVVMPSAIEVQSERYQSRGGAAMKGVTVLMRYCIFGPEGDSMEGSMYGEGSDSGDKGTTKAQSVAYRSFLLQALTLPTNDPDPDMENPQREEAEQNQAPSTDADDARNELFALLTRRKINPQKATFKFAEAGHGQIRESTDAAAIRSLIELFKKEPA